jgi:hypothetical protein
LVPGGRADIVVPHAGSFSAARNPYHVAQGGFTTEIADHFDADTATQSMHDELRAKAHARLYWPSILRDRFRLTATISSARLAYELAKIMFVDGEVELHIEKKSSRRLIF